MARLTKSIPSIPISPTICITLESCPLPPSMMIKSGLSQPFSPKCESLRVNTSFIDKKSSGLPSADFILNFLYSDFLLKPLMNVTIDATVFVPCMCDMS